MEFEGDLLHIDDELHDVMRSVFGDAAQACFQCGACTATCPWGVVSERPWSIREIMRRAQLGIDETDENIWLCTDCGQCLQTCPRGVPIPEVIRAWRDWLWKNREVEDGLPTVLWSIFWNGNPLSQPPSERMNWAEGLDLQSYDHSSHEYLLYIGCTASYDPRAQKVARSVVRILQKTGAKFGVLGEQERCCGECVLRMGHRAYFEELAELNARQYRSQGVHKVITISPHCYDAFKNHYPDGDLALEAIHYTHYMQQIFAAQEVELPATYAGTISFHDPCLLSRANPEFEVSREILGTFEEIQFVELNQSRGNTLCCGGGGGRMFLETLPGERFSDARIEEARQQQIQTLVTTCPLCISCLEDSKAAIGAEEIEVLDLAELVVAAMATGKSE